MKKPAALCTTILLLSVLTACSSVPDSVSREETPSGIVIEKFDNIPGLIKLVRSPKRGYHYDAYLWIPSEYGRDDIRRLLVSPNNSGTADDSLEFHEEKALYSILNNWEYRVVQQVKVPHLMPVFPRPRTDWHLYTHSLDSDTMAVSSGKLKRIDLQLLAMIDDARTYLAWQDTTQYIYMGELDDNDTTLYDDGFTREEADLV